MDELIRELQSKAESARALRDTHPRGSRKWCYWDEMGQTWDHATSLAVQAKRRMAEREPAWNLQP